MDDKRIMQWKLWDYSCQFCWFEYFSYEFNRIYGNRANYVRGHRANYVAYSEKNTSTTQQAAEHHNNIKRPSKNGSLLTNWLESK